MWLALHLSPVSVCSETPSVCVLGSGVHFLVSSLCASVGNEGPQTAGERTATFREAHFPPKHVCKLGSVIRSSLYAFARWLTASHRPVLWLQDDGDVVLGPRGRASSQATGVVRVFPVTVSRETGVRGQVLRLGALSLTGPGSCGTR